MGEAGGLCLDKEGGVWRDAEEGLWLDKREVCDVKIHILPPREGGQDQGTPALLYAPSGLLCSIPYFATCLSEPWLAKQTSDGSPVCPSQREVSVECNGSSSPADYCRCLLFLKPQELVDVSVDSIARVLRAADHLLYQECADLCMSLLASVPWSNREEEMIQQTISVMGLKPSSDLSAKLSSSKDVQAFKEVLLGLIGKVGSSEGRDATLREFVSTASREGSPKLVKICDHVLREAWASATKDLMIYSVFGGRIGFWNMLTILILDHGDAQGLLEDFVAVSNKLCPIIMQGHDFSSMIPALLRLLLRAVPSKQDVNFVLLSNAHRATLVAACTPMVARSGSKPVESAFEQLFATLPLQDPVVVALVKKEVDNAYFQACYTWWCTKMFQRLKQCDLIQD